MEPAVKKYAEVAAFVALAQHIYDKAGTDFSGYAAEVAQQLQLIATTSLPPVPDDQIGLFETKQQKTLAKLTAMMETYIGDDWDNPVEVLEWSSFFAGAGAAHCAIAGSRFKQAGSVPDIEDCLHDLQPRFSVLLDDVINRLAA